MTMAFLTKVTDGVCAGCQETTPKQPIPWHFRGWWTPAFAGVTEWGFFLKSRTKVREFAAKKPVRVHFISGGFLSCGLGEDGAWLVIEEARTRAGR